MSEIEKLTPEELKELKAALDEAYKNCGQNAYFGNGFMSGYDYAKTKISKLEIENKNLISVLEQITEQTNLERKKLQARNKELEGENKEMKSTMQYLWQLEFLNSGQYGYAVRANTFKYVDREIAEQALKTFNCPSCGANWDTGKHNSCSCGANISRTSTK